MIWIQKTIRLRPRPRGFHLVTAEILGQLPELAAVHLGVMHLFIQHTSASLTVNENVDPSVRVDFERHLRELVPDDGDHFTHRYEGPDDMTSHIKASLLGSSVTLPITHGRPNLGAWQGIYLGEHRERAGSRQVVVTVWGDGGSEL